MVFLILAKFFGWGPCFTKIKGIELKEIDGSFDFKKFKDDGYSFVMMKSGERLLNEEENIFTKKMDEAREKEVQVGAFWEISAENETIATAQATAAATFLEGKKGKLAYNIYLKINKEILENVTITNDICKVLTNKSLQTGIVLSYEQYKNYYKEKVLNHITNYWISDYNKEFDEDEEDKVALWNLDDKYNGNPIIQAKKK